MADRIIRAQGVARLIRGGTRDRVLRAPARSRLVRGGRGAPGANAATGFAFSFSGAFQASEELPGYPIGGLTILSATASVAMTRTPPTATTVFTIVKNGGVAIGTVTFTAGSLDANGVRLGTVAITDPTLVLDDYVYLVAPATPDATLSQVAVTLAGN